MPRSCVGSTLEALFDPQNRLFATPVLAVAVTICLGCSEEKLPPTNWKEFVSTAGRYRATMPSVPEHSEQKAPMPWGTSVMTDLARSSDGRSFAIVYADYPPGPDTTEEELAHQVLDSVVLGVNKSNQDAIRRRKKIMLGKHHGQECFFDLTAQGRVRQYRAYLVDNRLYQLFADSSMTKDKTSADAEKFMNSFQLNPSTSPNP